MEHVIRKGWGFPKPKCDANSGGCSCCCFVPPCFRCIKEEDEEDAQVNGVAHGGKETERIDTKQDSADLSSPATQSRLTKKTRKRMLRRVAGIILSLSLASAFIMFQQQARHAVLAVELYLIDQNTAASNNPVTIAARFKLLSWLSSGLGGEAEREAKVGRRAVQCHNQQRLFRSSPPLALRRRSLLASSLILALFAIRFAHLRIGT